MKLGGGQIWTQDDFPCFSIMLIPIDHKRWIMVNDPRRNVGNMAIGWDNRVFWSSEDLEAFLERPTPFILKGQLYDLINDHWYEALCSDPPPEGRQD